MSLKEPSKKTYYFLQSLFAVIGLAFSLYLLVHHTRVTSGIQDKASICSFASWADCDVVNVSPYSEILGIPVAGIGAFFFFTLLMIGLLFPPKEKNFALFQKLMAWIVVLGLTVDVFLFVWAQLIVLKTFCLFCFLTYVSAFLHLWANQKIAGGWKKSLKAPTTFSLSTIPWIRVAPTIISLICFIALLAFLPQYIRSQSNRYQRADDAVAQFYATWSDKTRKEIPVQPGDATFGNPNAKVKVVVFSDFQCPFCKRAAFTLHNLMKPMESTALFVFKNYPLDTSCNPIPYQMHPYACRLARLGYCAEAKGKFWEYHNRVFLELEEEAFKEGFDVIEAKIKDIFTPAEINSCLNNPKSLAKITEDIQAGNQMAIRGTPATFINGKAVTIPVNLESMRKLIELERALP